MAVSVRCGEGGHVLVGDWAGAADANAFLDHLRSRAFSSATVRAYAFDIANFATFLAGQRLELAQVAPMDVFAWVAWQGVRTTGTPATVVRLAPRRAAPSTVNRRVAAVRGFFEFLLIGERVPTNPVPAPRRGKGLRPSARNAGTPWTGTRPGRRPVGPRTAPTAGVAGAGRRAVLSEESGHAPGPGDGAGDASRRAAFGRSPWSAPAGRRPGPTPGAGARQGRTGRVVPVDPAFFAELGAYLRHERPAGLATAECSSCCAVRARAPG